LYVFLMFTFTFVHKYVDHGMEVRVSLSLNDVIFPNEKTCEKHATKIQLQFQYMNMAFSLFEWPRPKDY
jgi:hypothetical protein